MGSFVSQFGGTAGFYARYRPSYPDEVWDFLAREAQLGPESSILDLGCGPGTATLSLARRVGAVTAVDAESEMLVEARAAAAAAGITNVQWVDGPAETFADERDTYHLVVVASAFHWMDRQLVAARCHRLLTADGLFAVVNNPTPLIQIRERTGVGAAIAEVQDRWFGDDFFPHRVDRIEGAEEVLQASPFAAVETHYLPCRQHWDAERLVGFLRSTSSRPDQRLGPRFAAFADEIHHAVRTVEPSGRWTFDTSVQIFLARKTTHAHPDRHS